MFELTQPGDETSSPDEPLSTPRTLTTAIAFLATVLLGCGLLVMPTQYVVSSPGPTRDTLGTVPGTEDELITIAGAETFPGTGELRLTTVSILGGPGYRVDAVRVAAGWLSPQAAVAPVEAYFAPEETAEQVKQESTAAMTTSQEDATVAALTEAGYTVPATLTVVGVIEGTGAVGVLREGDVVTGLDGTTISTYQQLVETLAALEPGASVTVAVTRDGAKERLSVVAGERPGGGALLGVYLDPEFDLPLDVDIKITDIGGPSAGMMFALGIVDLLTPADELAGQVVAGTGTVDVVGRVGGIGGIRQKMYGARAAGATWFLAPAANCSEVVGNVPAGLEVTKVATLAEARAAVEAIGAGEGAPLPRC